MAELSIHMRFKLLLDAIGKMLDIDYMASMHHIAIERTPSMGYIGNVVLHNPITGNDESLPNSDECIEHGDAIYGALKSAIPWLNEFLMDLRLECDPRFRQEHPPIAANIIDSLSLFKGKKKNEPAKLALKNPKKHTGAIHLFIGPMGSGKTEALLREIRIHRVRKHKCILIKHSNDDERGGIDRIKTKYGLTESGHSTKTLREQEHLAEDCDVIGIDEGQFFRDLTEMCVQWASEGKIVIVAALNGDYLMKPFDEVSRLFPKCESIEMLNAICAYCQKSASFSKRIVDMGNVQSVAGGFDIYSPTCRKCYYAKITPNE